MRCNVDLTKIKIPFYFKKPSEKKMEQCREYFRRNGRLDREIIVNENMVLIDGYVGYLVLKENNIKGAGVLKNGEKKKKKRIIVHGRHTENSSRTYCWKVVTDTKNIENMRIGGFAIVRTSFGDQIVEITQIEEVYQNRMNVRHKRVVEFL